MYKQDSQVCDRRLSSGVNPQEDSISGTTLTVLAIKSKKNKDPKLSLPESTRGPYGSPLDPGCEPPDFFQSRLQQKLGFRAHH